MSRLTFTAPPPGLGSVTDFELNTVEGAQGLYSLQASADPDLGMFLISSDYVPGYAPPIPESRLSELGLESGSEAPVLLVARADGPVTVNLMAPIIINQVRGLASQVILEGEDYPVRAELACA